MKHKLVIMVIFLQIIGGIAIQAKTKHKHMIQMEHDMIVQKGTFEESVLLFTHMDQYYLDFHKDH